MNLRITVTQEDIDAGCVKNGTNCAIARAIARVFERVMWVTSFGIADGKLKEVSPEDVLFTYPGEILEWICKFDRREKVQPVTFEITPVDRPEAVKVSEEMAAFAGQH